MEKVLILITLMITIAFSDSLDLAISKTITEQKKDIPITVNPFLIMVDIVRKDKGINYIFLLDQEKLLKTYSINKEAFEGNKQTLFKILQKSQKRASCQDIQILTMIGLADLTIHYSYYINKYDLSQEPNFTFSINKDDCIESQIILK